MGSSAPDRPVTPCSLVAVPAWRSIPRRQRENLRVLDSRAHDDDALRASRVDVQDRLQERVIREGRVRVQMHDPASDRHVRDAPVARHADRHFGHGQSSKTSVVHCSSPPVTSTPGYPGGTWISNSYSAPDVRTAPELSVYDLPLPRTTEATFPVPATVNTTFATGAPA